ncbi:hypothetical protein V6N11_051995 [Hibiscus sabdariffa]|uniref:Retrotransposon gag domain-containing protein n=1 Tax=Hibiscus sabdariffa TaxID=183260 RepID=A0ABR2U8N1_9ROSI
MFNMLNTLGQFGGSPAENARQHLKQEDDEAMHEAWKHYRDLFRRCPMHGLPKWTQVSIFYNSVNTPTRMMLDASDNGTLLDKPPRESLEILEMLAQNDYQHPTTCRGNMRRGTAQLDSSHTILAQISALTNMVKSPRIQLLRQRIQQKHYVKYIKPSVEEAPKLLVAEPEQHPQSTAVNSTRISEPAEATEPAKAGLPTAQQLQIPGEHTEHIHDTNICLYDKEIPVHLED